MSADSLSQSGVIDSIQGNIAFVRIECYTACATCHASEGCISSDKKDRLIEAPVKGRQFSIGQTVKVSTPKSNGIIAVIWAYLVPFFILLISLIIYLNFFSETIAGLLCLATLVPYYITLYLLKNFFKQKFEFEINS
jgi:sigma-E factor negative regulatory protein RseC